MNTKVKNKSILLLIFINFILLTVFDNLHTVLAVDNSNTTKEIEVVSRNVEITNKDDLLSPESNYVEYELVDNVFVTTTEVKVKKIEEMKLEVQRKREEERQLAILKEMKTVSTNRQTSIENINVYTDLSIMNTIDADQMNSIINYWNSITKNGTPFIGLGQVFIDASKQSGLDPIYILAHAALESNWGKESMAHNYFGIGAFDNNPTNGYNYGNSSIEEGIINGAVWIRNNFYNNNQTCLYTMRYNNGSHEYCTSETWMHDIVSIMTTSYSIIK